MKWLAKMHQKTDLSGTPMKITSIQVGEDDEKKGGHLFF